MEGLLTSAFEFDEHLAGLTAMSRTAPQLSASLRILWVEDHVETLQIFARLLRHFGYEVALADCAESALQLVESIEFDLLLSDMDLPDGSAYRLVSQAKRKQSVKAIALAGFCTDEDIRRSKEAGFDFYLTKPVDFFELRTVLNQLAATWPYRQRMDALISAPPRVASQNTTSSSRALEEAARTNGAEMFPPVNRRALDVNGKTERKLS